MSKKILIVGGTGTVGSAVAKAMQANDYEVITAGYSNGDVQVDITSTDSIKVMYKQVGRVDAVVSTVGKLHFGALVDFTEEQYQIGLNNKLMGQVNLVTLGIDYVNDNGSFTLTAGTLNRDPIEFGVSAAMVNGALEGFTHGAALEMPRGQRINVVSPTVVTESTAHFSVDTSQSMLIKRH